MLRQFLNNVASRVAYGAYDTVCKVFSVAILIIASVNIATAQVEVVALGDSLTAGYGLPNDQGFVPQLQAWVRDAGSDAVISNAGVSGDTTAGGLARLNWSLGPNVGALIVELGANDILRGLDPGAARVNLSEILTGAAERGLPVLLVGAVAPTNYGPEYKAAFDTIYPDLAAEFDTLYYPNFLGEIVKEGLEKGLTLVQADGLHPTREGVALIVADMGALVLELIEQVAQKDGVAGQN